MQAILDGQDLLEIGRSLGVSRQRVQQIREKSTTMMFGVKVEGRLRMGREESPNRDGPPRCVRCGDQCNTRFCSECHCVLGFLIFRHDETFGSLARAGEVA